MHTEITPKSHDPGPSSPCGHRRSDETIYLPLRDVGIGLDRGMDKFTAVSGSSSAKERCRLAGIQGEGGGASVIIADFVSDNSLLGICR